jgi:hypothetical protein
MSLEVVQRIKDDLILHPDVQRNKTQWSFGWDQTKWPVAKYPLAVSFPSSPSPRIDV